jgi:AraC-like DNA-binding protein
MRDTFGEHFRELRVNRSTEMTRMRRVVLERKLEQARRLALEPTAPLTGERLAQIIQQLEFQLQDQRKVA